jgi:predicted PurR-regulated permease PerM
MSSDVESAAPAESARSSTLKPRAPRSLEWTVAALCVGALATFLPLWAPLLIASWVAILVSPLQKRLARHGTARQRSAAVLTTALVILVLAPLVTMGISLSAGAAELYEGLLKSESGTSALRVLLSDGSAPEGAAKGAADGGISLETFKTAELTAWLQSHGKDVYRVLGAVASAATRVILTVLIFVLATYAFLVRGGELTRWLLERAPVHRADAERFGRAFAETGRGLLIGVGGAAFVQGLAAGIGYSIIGIPRGFVLGFVTGVAGLIPLVGTALVWVPIAVGLFLFDHPGQAAATVAVGLVVSSADNVLRPLLARVGNLQLPAFVVFVSMLGGLATFGAAGVFLGPLLVRLAVEGLEIVRERRTEAPPA